MNVLDILSQLESYDDLHLARLLILIDTFTDHNENKTINGLTKLAKLDFLLRYPVYLERALKARGIFCGDIASDYERTSVECSMIRYHYGPWDPRYRLFINILVSKGLAFVYLEKRTIKIGLTSHGLEKALLLSQESVFNDILVRSRILHDHFDIGATELKDFLYDAFPEIISLKLGEEIKL